MSGDDCGATSITSELHYTMGRDHGTGTLDVDIWVCESGGKRRWYDTLNLSETERSEIHVTTTKNKIKKDCVFVREIGSVDTVQEREARKKIILKLYAKRTFSPGRPSDRRTTAYKVTGELIKIKRRECEGAHVFATDFPARFFLVEPFRSLVTFKADNNVTLNGAKRANFGCARGACHRTNSNIERCR